MNLDDLAAWHASYTAPYLAWAVAHHDRELIAELLEPLDIINLRALAVVLAAQVPRPNTRPDDGVIDEVAVRRAAAGEHRGPLTRAERIAAVRLMHQQGARRDLISRRLGVSWATIGRILGPGEPRRRESA